MVCNFFNIIKKMVIIHAKNESNLGLGSRFAPPSYTPSTSSSSNVASVASSSSVTSSGINDNDQPGNESEQQDPGMILPGPRQLTTNPGVPSTNPTTGMRQRRVGVSGPPSGV